MADEIDIAHEREQSSIEEILARRVQYRGESAEACEDCGEIIPGERREGVPGVRTCVPCQSARELKAKRLRLG